MLRATLLVLVLAVATACVGTPDTVAPATGTLTVQPDKVPGPWQLTTQPLPPLDAILQRPTQIQPVYGLYIWMGEYKKLRESLKKVGWRTYRVGGPFTDDDMKMIVEDGVEVVKCLQLDPAVTAGKQWRNDYKDDAMFLADYLKSIEAFLGHYGPGGTFFKDNPAAAQRPIRFIEVWNEPNFQYMIPDREPRAEVEAQREALYAKVLPTVYQLVKTKWPKVQVVGFGAGGAGAGDLRFVEHVLAFDKDAPWSMDALSTHPYVDPSDLRVMSGISHFPEVLGNPQLMTLPLSSRKK